MAFEFGIMWDDLTEEAKQEIRNKASDEGYQLEENDRNWDVFPIAAVELEADEGNNDNDDLEASEPDVSTIKTDGLSLKMNTLHSKQELIDYLSENGPTHSVLMDFCSEYLEQYSNVLYWPYPISDGKHLGTFLVLVKEGILSLPYDGADIEDYELFCLEDIRMFNTESMDVFIEAWNLFAENLQAVMRCMRNFLAGREKLIQNNLQTLGQK